MEPKSNLFNTAQIAALYFLSALFGSGLFSYLGANGFYLAGRMLSGQAVGVNASVLVTVVIVGTKGGGTGRSSIRTIPLSLNSHWRTLLTYGIPNVA
jgi:hypothetical protein